jgi:hypothetical protein
VILRNTIASGEKRVQQDRVRVHTLARIDSQTISDGAGEIRAVMSVRNEILRLSQTLDHYRKIGVSRFFCHRQWVNGRDKRVTYSSTGLSRIPHPEFLLGGEARPGVAAGAARRIRC